MGMCWLVPFSDEDQGLSLPKTTQISVGSYPDVWIIRCEY